MNWTKELFEEFKQAYSSAESDIFIFHGHEILKSYAKYLIEYLSKQFS